MSNKGTVYLVGAGPGDPELLTVRAMRLIMTADVVVYDRLVSPGILALIPGGVARIDVGKRPGSHPVPQKDINRILIQLARAGRRVVRLKGGDPMIFGRGGEEVRALAENGVAVETVPGITAAQGCAASLNLALTQRGIASCLVYLTGHAQHSRTPDTDWARLVRARATLAIYMGAAKIGAIAARLMGAGLAGATPALAVCNATLPRQRQILSDIAHLAEAVAKARFEGPVLFVIGDAAGAISTHGVFQDAPETEQAAASRA